MPSLIVCTAIEVRIKQLLLIFLASRFPFPYPRLSRSIIYCYRIVIAGPLCRCVTVYCIGDEVSNCLGVFSLFSREAEQGKYTGVNIEVNTVCKIFSLSSPEIVQTRTQFGVSRQ